MKGLTGLYYWIAILVMVLFLTFWWPED